MLCAVNVTDSGALEITVEDKTTQEAFVLAAEKGGIDVRIGAPRIKEIPLRKTKTQGSYYVNDDSLLLNLRDLRSIRKIDLGDNYAADGSQYQIQFRYVASTFTEGYKAREMRDAMYQKICDALIESPASD